MKLGSEFMGQPAARRVCRLGCSPAEEGLAAARSEIA